MHLRPVAIGLSPNTEWNDYVAATKTLLTPWRWKKGKAIGELETWFNQKFNTNTAVSFNAGRSALFALLKAFGIGKGDEVIVQAFTCIAVPNSVVWVGAKPVFADIDGSLNLDILDIEKKLTSKTRAVIVQHTFGTAANLEKISAFCKENELLLIEDCAHALGATYKEQLLGTFGDGAFFSFGRDKIISSVFGGMAIVKDGKVFAKLKAFQDTQAYPDYFWILQQLLYPLVSAIVLLSYNFLNVGKLILFISQQLKLVSFPVYSEEKMSKQPRIFPKILPNALASLGLVQLKKLDRYNRRRSDIAQIYKTSLDKKFEFSKTNNDSIFLRLNIETANADRLRFLGKKRGMLLGNWYSQVIDPKGSRLEELYIWGSCPNAEKLARLSLNLPTYPTISDAQVHQVCDFLLTNG